MRMAKEAHDEDSESWDSQGGEVDEAAKAWREGPSETAGGALAEQGKAERQGTLIVRVVGTVERDLQEPLLQ